VSAEAGVGVASARDWVGLVAILAATFLGQVDGFVVTVAAPSVQRDLPATFGEVRLVGASYVLAAAAGLITGGRLGDRFGRRVMFLAGAGGFTLASLVCGAAPTVEVLIGARFVQGAAAAVLIPQELALVRAIFTDAAQRARALSGYGVALGLGVISGLAGGGLLVHWDVFGLGWRAAFLVNVPIGVVIVVLGRTTISESRASVVPSLDLVGAVLAAVALPALLTPLVLDGAGWPVAVVGVLASIVLIGQQRALAARGGAPLFPPHVLTAPGMPARLAAIATFFSGNAGLFLVFTYYTQTGLGHDPLTAGLMFTPLGVGFVAGSAVSGRLTVHWGQKVPVAGCAVLTLALLGHLAVVHAPAQTVLLGVAIGLVGLAEGLVVAPLVAGVLDRIAPDDAGSAAGAAATVTQFGLALGFAGVGAWYQHVLGAVPGTAAAPADQRGAYSAAIAVLVLLAVSTGLLCARRR
jgi:MFS family permease